MEVTRDLTCSVLYTPSKNELAIDSDNLKYLCKDNKIHIRFRDYNKKQVIRGFESKLTYLLTYLMNYWYLPQVIQKYDSDKLIEDFLETKEITKLVLNLNLFLNTANFKGLKLSKNYKRKNSKDFGDTLLECFPSHKDEVEKIGGIDLFLEYFNFNNLLDYLFNDGIILIIHEELKEDITKFDRKQIRK